MRLRRARKNARVELLPLMDVVFLLLVFFIYSMMLMAVHRGMPVALPTSSTAEPEKLIVLALTIKADGSLFLDKDSVSLEQLPEALKQRVAGQGQNPPPADGPSLQVFADGALPYQTLYRVLDVIKAAGIRKISLQARQEGS